MKLRQPKAQLRHALFAALMLVSAIAHSSSSALRIRELPTSADTWAEIRSAVLAGVDEPGVKIEESGSSLTLRHGDELYQAVLHNGDVIQFSTVTSRERGVGENIQFGRSQERKIAPYLQKSPELAKAHAFLTREAGVSIHESSDAGHGTDFRSALLYPESGEAPTIHLSDRYAKHPVFGFAHEMQHFFNQPLLPMLVEKVFEHQDVSRRVRHGFRSYLDEYLAVSMEIRLYRELAPSMPHLATQELVELARMSEADLKNHVFGKWQSYYQWPPELLKAAQQSSLPAEKWLIEIHAFQHKYGAKTDLPPKHKRLLDFEQKHNPKVVDEAVIASPKNTHLPWTYRPEAGLSFPLRTVWIPAEHLQLAVDQDALPTAVRAVVTRMIDGKLHYAYFMHPLSEEKLSGLIERYPSTFEFVATPGSSNRTLTVRSMKSGIQLYVKTSLAVPVAGIERTVPMAEVSRSVGYSIFLRTVAEKDERILFLPEPLALIPKGLERGGQVVRLLEANQPTKELVPLFSLFDSSGGRDLTGEIASRLGVSKYHVLKHRIAGPLLALLKDLRDKSHFVHEAHAQNILVEMSNGIPTGRFVFKDLAGLNVDLSKYPSLAARLPHFRSLNEDYYQHNLSESFRLAFDGYFKSGALYGMDQYLKKTEPRSTGQPPLSDLLATVSQRTCSDLFR